jgi:hypothetical protein
MIRGKKGKVRMERWSNIDHAVKLIVKMLQTNPIINIVLILVDSDISSCFVAMISYIFNIFNMSIYPKCQHISASIATLALNTVSFYAISLGCNNCTITVDNSYFDRVDFFMSLQPLKYFIYNMG